MSDVFGLAGEPTLVVGGGSGIGRATAMLLARVGARVAVADVDAERAAQVRDEVAGLGAEAVAVAGDVTAPEEARDVVDRAHRALGGLAGVVDVVGLASWGDLLAMDLTTWDGDLRGNLTHHLLVGQAAARHMIDDGRGGSLVLVGSVSGLYGAPNHAAYGAAKAGVAAVARSMAVEWGPHGIRVNALAPDIIATPRVVAGFAERGISDLDRLAVDDGVPLRRWGTPDEVAGALVFLLSDLSSFVTGQQLVVDGGTRAIFPHPGPKAFTEG